MTRSGVNGIQRLLDLNATHSAMFQSTAESTRRRQYRQRHPTEIGVMKCMDGRINFSVIAKVALGIIQPFRNLGGKFNLGWPMFQETLEGFISYAMGNGRDVLLIVTYHFSSASKKRGCRGFNYDKEAALAAAMLLKQQLEQLGQTVIYSVVFGVSTDLDALVLHGDNGEVVDVAELEVASPDDLADLLRRLYPHMPFAIRRDLLPLVWGNLQHVGEIKAAQRTVVDSEHREWVLGVGRGFDWLHTPNTALIVGPYDLINLEESIGTAAKLLKGNLDEGRLEGNRIVLMSSAQYRDVAGIEPVLAREKARFLGSIALEVVRKRVPALMEHLQLLVTCVDMNTRELKVLERRDEIR